MIKNTCPQCESELSWKDQGYFCDYCQQKVTKTAFCPDCSEQLILTHAFDTLLPIEHK